MSLALTVAIASAAFGVMLGAFTILPDYLELRKMPSELKRAADGVRTALYFSGETIDKFSVQIAVAAAHVAAAIKLGAFERAAAKFEAVSAGGLRWKGDPAAAEVSATRFHAFMVLTTESGFRAFPHEPSKKERLKYYSDAIRHVAQQIDDCASSLE